MYIRYIYKTVANSTVSVIVLLLERIRGSLYWWEGGGEEPVNGTLRSEHAAKT